MTEWLHAAFEASDPERNVARSYRVAVDRDLFGVFTLTTHFGRIGATGTMKRVSAATVEELRLLARRLLRRRLSAERRIGCGYRLVSFEAAGGVRQDDWVPAELLPG
jgi:predicted DNA-binding WGR domain protein